MVTAETRTHLIGLSVVMLGSAPGTDLLNEWIEAMDGGATLEDIANHIAASDAFQATYPPLQTNREFAEDMLESLIGSEVVPGVLRAAAADIVVSLLNDGMTRGALALAVVGALSDIAAQGEEHPAYGDLGNVAHAIANKTEVAAHHTIEKRIAEPSSDALAGVTSDAATVEAAIRDIDSPPADAVFDEVGTLSVTENADGSGMPGDDNAPISAGYVTATDSNGDAVSYSIEGDPADWMILEDGKLCYVGAGLDHEAGDAVSLNIVATSIGADGAETSVVRNVSVMVGDVQESDAVFADATLAIDENETAGMVGSVTATDAEDDAVTYRLADGSPEGFSIDEETGAVSYAGEGLDHETAATVDLTVIATSIGASNMETDVSRTFTVMVGDVDDLPERKPDPIPLTPTIDDLTGSDDDDTFVAEPVQVADGRFNATLNSFDSIDGGGGNDTLHIFGVDPEALRLGAEDVTNVENVVITTVGDIDADLRDWTGLESVTLDRFGRDNETTVRVIVDGAMVNTDRAFNGDVTIVGANGAVNIEAGSGSDVHVGSAGHTETVMVKGGMSVRVDNGAGGGNKQSMTVTSVSVDGVARDPGEKDPAKPADSSNVREATIPTGNSGLTPSESVVQYVRQLAEDETPPSSDTTVDGVTPVTAREAALNTYYIADQAKDNLPEGVTLATGMILVTSDITKAEGYVAEVEEGNPTGSEPTLYVDSDSIETVALHNTRAIVAVTNQSKTADGKDMPEDLSVTVDGYGSFQPWGAVKQAGKLCIGGSGSAENIEITVAGASAFDLASGAVKMIDISGDARLVLGVDNFKEDDNPADDGVSKTLESVTVSGGAGVTMAGLSGMSSLTMIDASASSGNNRFQSKADPDGLFPDADNDELEALTMVKGGSGKDTVALATSAGGELESIDTGDGNDAVTVIGMLRSEGLTVDLGAGDDVYSGRASNSESRIDGGDGMDILHLTSTANSTYRDADNKVQSIYTGFETLNVALGSGDYDIEQLGIVNDVLATATTGSVTLENMADGMGIRVHGIQGSGRGRSTDTTAMIVHESADDRRSDELDVHLLAQGRNDTRANTKGEAMLVLTTDEDIEVINISSNATAHSSTAALADNKPVRTSDYENKLTLTSTAVEELVIDGNAKLAITVMADVDGTAATRLDEVDAKDNSGGVTFAFSGTDAQIALLVQSIELDGGSGADKLTGAAGSDEISGGGGRDTLIGGAGADEISGGAGGDTLTGGADADTFEYTSASQSQVAWTATGAMYGFDTINDFTSGTDEITLGDTLFDGLYKALGATVRTVTGEINNNDATSAESDNSLREWLGNGNGVFETETGTGLNAVTTQHAVTLVTENYHRDFMTGEDADTTGAIDLDGDGTTDDGIGLYRTWLLIDVNADGDFDATIDMAIALTGASADTAISVALTDIES